MRPGMASTSVDGPRSASHVVIGAHGHDAVTADRDGLGSAPRGVAAPHVGVGDDQVGALCIRHGADPSMETTTGGCHGEHARGAPAGGHGEGDEVDIRDSGVAAAAASRDLFLTNGGAGVLAAAGNLTITNGGGGPMAIGGNVSITNGGAQTILAAGGATLGERSFVAFVLSPKVTVEPGAKVLCSTRRRWRSARSPGAPRS